MTDHKEEIRNRLSWQLVLSLCGMQPPRKGKIKSIFNPNDKTPSMHLNNNGTYKCFSTGNSGDYFTFYETVFNCDFKTALERLGSAVNVDVVNTPVETYHRPTPPPIPEMPKYSFVEKKEQVLKNSEIFHRLFLYQHETFAFSRTEAFAYLRKRGLSDDTIGTHTVYIHDPKATHQHLKERFGNEALRAAGLTNDKGNFIFCFHPILILYTNIIDGETRITYVRGRYFFDGSPNNGNNAKYLGLSNPPPGVNTTKRFFNDDLLNTLEEGSTVYICEGEFDAMVLQQAGLNVLAIPGVSAFPETSELMKLKPYNVVLCLDSDQAGQTASTKLAGILRDLGIKCSIKSLPKNVKDVSDLSKRGGAENV